MFMLDNLLQDIRYTLRTLARNRMFSFTALSMLALGIGANTAMFSVVHAVILQPFPFAGQERLVQLYGTPVERGEAIAAADAEGFRNESQSFEAIAGYNAGARYLQEPDGLRRVMTVDVERGFFTMLGVQPEAGRTFGPADISNVAVASALFSTEVGKRVTVDGMPLTIVGVMPASFQFPYSAASRLQIASSETRTDLWILADSAPGQPRRGRLGHVTGRLKPNVTLNAAAAELNVIMRRLESANPNRLKGLGVRLLPLSDAVVSPPVRRSLFILFAAAGVVLLLACANIANLLLVQVVLRTKEIAARAAVGAAPSRLMRQFLTESLVVSLIGGGGGLVLAWWGSERLTQLASAQLPRAFEAGMNWPVFVFSIAACIATGLLFGLAPTLGAMRTNPQLILNEAGRSTMSRRQRHLRDALVAVEVALAFILAVGATLLIRELIRLRNTEMGMIPDSVMTLHIGQTMQGVDARQFYDIVQRVRQVPGVREAGFTQMLPLQNSGWRANSTDFRIRGTPIDDRDLFSMELRYVTPGYFRALGIPIVRGRGITEQDTRDAPHVILINEALARRRFGNDDPIGKETTRGTIVGITGNVRQVHLDRAAEPEVYYPIAQNWSQIGEIGMSLVVKTDGPPLALTSAVRAAIREVNPNAAIFGIRTMDRIARDSLADFTLYLTLMSAFSGLALFLACSGTYGVISFLAAARNREFAIRTALGAGRSQVTRLVLHDAIRLTVIGMTSGLIIVILMRPLLQNLPVSVRPPGVLTVLPVAFAITFLTLMACVIPARRAAVSDPMTALRQD